MPIQIAGSPVTHGSAAIGLTITAAVMVSTAVTRAISVSGIAKRIVRARASMSAVVRETRSPLPARSTVESGSASTRAMKSSRRRAKTSSESTNEARRANQVSSVWATHERRQHERPVGRRARWSCPSLDALDQPAEDRRPGEAGDRGERVQPITPGERAAVAPREPARVNAHLRRRPRSGGARSLVLASRHGHAVGGGRRSSSRCVPTAATRPLVEEEDAVGAGRARAGWRSRRPSFGPRAPRAGDAATRASVWASTALVGSTSTRISGIGEQRAGQREALPLTAGEAASALLDVLVEAFGQRVENVLGVRRRRALRAEASSPLVRAPRVELAAQRAGEEHRVRLADDDPSARPPRR